jgi:uncharacterized protein (TIGR04255 family)
MTTPEYLPNAPISEAVIEVRVQPRDGLDRAMLSAAHTQLRDKYPTIESVGPDELTDASGEAGYLFRSADGFEVAQFLRSGFSFNRLRPYTRWELIFPEALRVWTIYQNVMAPPLVTRAGVRYINRLEFPQPVQDLHEYLAAPPPIPEGLPREISGFITVVTIQDSLTGREAEITQALEGYDDNAATVILDIDTRKSLEVSPDDVRIEATLESLREFKNAIFFQSITDRTKRLFL